MKSAFLKGAAFLQDVATARQLRDQLHVWWLGQSGFLCCWNNQTVLFDPYLSDSLTRKYAETDKPHTRMTEQVVEPGQLDFVDVVTSSHNHTDHLDAETLIPLFRANPNLKLLAPEANRAFVADRLQREPSTIVGIDDGASVTLDGLRFHGIAAAHDELKTDENGQHHFLGFILRWGPWTLYHSGDTRLYEGLAARLKKFTIDLAFLPINGFRPERRVAGNLNAIEATALATTCEMKHVVPHHFDMFEFNTVEPYEFGELAHKADLPHTILRNGERLTLDPR